MDTEAFNKGFEKVGQIGSLGVRNAVKAGVGGVADVAQAVMPQSVQKFLGRRFFGNMSPETKVELGNEEIRKGGYGDYGSLEVVDGKVHPKINWGGAAKGFWNTITNGITKHPILAGLGVGGAGLGLMSLLGGGGNNGGGTVNNYYSSSAPTGQTIKPNLQANIQSGDGFSAAGYHQV